MSRIGRLPRPFIVCVITDQTVDDAIVTMRTGMLDGAHTHEINLPALAREPAESLSRLFSVVPGPIYTTCRRRSFMTVYGIAKESLPEWSDDERMKRQLAAIAMGSAALDIELDTFDPMPGPPIGTTEAEKFSRTSGPPSELTFSPVAIQRQRDLAATAKSLGAEVLFSCHTCRPQTTQFLVDIANTAVTRGADLVKIVSPCRGRADLFELLEATAQLARTLPVPFTLVGAGAAGQLSRTIGVNFGSSWAIGQQRLVPGGFHPQPLVSHLRETMRLVPWQASGEA